MAHQLDLAMPLYGVVMEAMAQYRNAIKALDLDCADSIAEFEKRHQALHWSLQVLSACHDAASAKMKTPLSGAD
jgi:hypothetical protein